MTGPAPGDDRPRGVAFESRGAGTAAEPQLERITRLACAALGAPMGVLVVRGADGLSIGALHGDELQQAPPEATAALCSPTASPFEAIAVGDASRDARFAHHPVVSGAPHARALAASPLFRKDGTPQGTLLVLSPRPGAWGARQVAALADFATLAAEAIETSRGQPHGLSPEELALAFPFAFVLDRGLRIVHCGASLPKVCQRAVLGGAFEEVFVVRRPVLEPGFERLASSSRDLFVIECARTGTVLRGSMMALGRGETVAFLGSPWLTASGDLERLGLAIDDFALHDPAMDLVQMLEARAQSIADLRQLNVGISEAKARAEEANRATGAFVAHISHELRTPMNAVLGMATVLSDTSLGPEQRDYVDTIRSSGENLLAVVNDVLDFSKIESGKMSVETVPFSLLRLMDDCLDLVALPSGRKGLDLAAWCEPGVPEWISGDPSRLRQILLNLISNAVRFTEKGHALVRASYAAETSSLELVVEDTGIGMTPAALRGVFLPFWQAESSTTRRFGGSGLGLTISRRLAELMGGTVNVESSLGVGTRFEVRLPAPPSEARGTSATPFVGGGRLVVFEESRIHERALLQRIARLGATGVPVGSLEAALSAAREGEADVLVVGVRGDVAQVSPVVERIRGAVATPLLLCVQAGVRVAAANLWVVPRPAELTRLARAIRALKGSSSPESPTSPSVRPPASLRVLLVEDDLVNQKVASLLLARLGLGCDVVSNGWDAIERVSVRSYDVVFMDVRMPELDGVETTRRIRALSRPQPYIVALSASALTEEREACFGAGVDAFLAKPVDPEELRTTLAAAAARQSA